MNYCNNKHIKLLSYFIKLCTCAVEEKGSRTIPAQTQHLHSTTFNLLEFGFIWSFCYEGIFFGFHVVFKLTPLFQGCHIQVSWAGYLAQLIWMPVLCVYFEMYLGNATKTKKETPGVRNCFLYLYAQNIYARYMHYTSS